MNKKYVNIQSQININVTCGLNFEDVTNPDAHIPDRLKISPKWPTCTVFIKQGVHQYPSEIVEWKTVKALKEGKLITIGDYVDEVDSENKEAEIKKREINEIMKNTKRGQNVKLADIVGVGDGEEDK